MNAEPAEHADQIFSASSASSAFKRRTWLLIRNGGHLPRIERREELACPFQIELRVGGLDAEEEPVPARQREAWHVEHRVIWLRQPVKRHHAVDDAALHSFTFASGRIVRISKIEIIGRKRRNRNRSERNKPIVPRNVDQSQNVGWYIPHEEGRKSRCRLVTMMTKRSSHMPTFTTSEIMKSNGTLVHTRFSQSACGTATLQKISSQYANAYGPVSRLSGTSPSYLSALYQAMNASVM